jgi:hypothetical protein
VRPVAQHRQPHALPRRHRGHRADQGARGFGALAVDGQHHVASAQAAAPGRAGALDAGDEHGAAPGARVVRHQVLHLHAEPAALHLAVAPERLDHGTGEVGGVAKPMPALAPDGE